MSSTTEEQLKSFYDWIKAHPTPATRYRPEGKALSFTINLEEAGRTLEDIEKGDEDDDGSEIFKPIADSATPENFLHCTVRDSIRRDYGAENHGIWELHCYEFERISWQAVGELCKSASSKDDFARIQAAARHGDYFTTGENGDYRGTSSYIFYGTPSQIAGGHAALIKTGREYGDGIPPEFYDAPNGYFADQIEDGCRELITVDVVPPPAYLVECDQLKNIVTLWQRASEHFEKEQKKAERGSDDDEGNNDNDDGDDDDDASTSAHSKSFDPNIASQFARRNPETDGFLHFAEENMTDDGGIDGDLKHCVIPLPNRPRAAALLKELMLVPSAVRPADWWSLLSAAQKLQVMGKEGGQRRGRSGSNSEQQEEEEEAEQTKKKPAPKKKAAAKKASAKKAASSSSSSSSSDDDDDDDKKKKKAPAKKASAKKAPAAAAAVNNNNDSTGKKKQGISWQFKSDLDASDTDDAAWGDYAADVAKTLETAFQTYTGSTAAKKKTKKVTEVDVSATHLVDFSFMMQFAKSDTNKQRAIRRVEHH